MEGSYPSCPTTLQLKNCAAVAGHGTDDMNIWKVSLSVNVVILLLTGFSESMGGLYM